MTLPSFLLVELRSSFRLCARQHAATKRCPITSSAVLLKRSHGFDRSSARQPSPPSKSVAERTSQAASKEPRSNSRGLTPTEEDGRSLETERKANVPMKVIPDAQLDAKHKLSPVQRLHIEHLTRHPPKQQAPRVYKERLLIYHFGVGRVNMMVFVRVLAILGLGFMTVIWVPAYYGYGTPIPYIAFVWALSFTPILSINWATRSIATEVWLKLPMKARQSPQAAMNYAKNLPRDAVVEVRFMRWTSHTGMVPINVVDTTPLKVNYFRPQNFKWVGPRADPGSRLRPNPTAYFVSPKSAEGRAVRDTIPGLWSAVYKRLTGVDSQAVSRWRS